jgi:hypothetical protein
LKCFLINVLAISGNLEDFFFSTKKTKTFPPEGEGEVGYPIFFLPQSFFVCEFKPHAKFHDTRTSPSGRKVCVCGGQWVGGWLRVNLVLRLGPNP